MFGLRTTRAAMLPGDIGYGVRLLHGVVPRFVFPVASPAFFSVGMTPIEFWAGLVGVLALVLLHPRATFRLTEQRFGRLPRRIPARAALPAAALQRPAAP